MPLFMQGPLPPFMLLHHHLLVTLVVSLPLLPLPLPLLLLLLLLLLLRHACSERRCAALVGKLLAPVGGLSREALALLRVGR